jgi:hypothetical protein
LNFCFFDGGKNLKRKLIIFGAIIILLTVGLSGCNNSSNTNGPLEPDEYGIIGTWVGLDNPDAYTFIFRSDKTFTFNVAYSWGISGGGTWKIEDDKLNLNVISGGESQVDVYDYSFSNNGEELTLINEKGSIYLTKQKMRV